MSISDILSEELTVVPMQAKDREEAIGELLMPLHSSNKIPVLEPCRESILRRERRMSTGVGKGVALPHGLSSSLDDVVVVPGISPGGIEFNAVDGMLCHIFVLLIGPESQPDRHLKLLSRFNKLLSESELRSALMDSRTPSELIAAIKSWEEKEEDVLP